MTTSIAPSPPPTPRLIPLQRLEAEAIHIMRAVVAEHIARHILSLP